MVEVLRDGATRQTPAPDPRTGGPALPRQLRLQGGPDKLAMQVFGNKVWAAKESDTTANSAVGKAERTFA